MAGAGDPNFEIVDPPAALIQLLRIHAPPPDDALVMATAKRMRKCAAEHVSKIAVPAWSRGECDWCCDEEGLTYGLSPDGRYVVARFARWIEKRMRNGVSARWEFYDLPQAEPEEVIAEAEAITKEYQDPPTPGEALGRIDDGTDPETGELVRLPKPGYGLGKIEAAADAMMRMAQRFKDGWRLGYYCPKCQKWVMTHPGGTDPEPSERETWRVAHPDSGRSMDFFMAHRECKTRFTARRWFEPEQGESDEQQ